MRSFTGGNFEGLYRVDARGVVLAHVPREESGPTARGRRFFDEVAPCGDPEFRGRFDALVARGGGEVRFDHDHGGRGTLRVRMFGCNRRGAWIVIAVARGERAGPSRSQTAPPERSWRREEGRSVCAEGA